MKYATTGFLAAVLLQHASAHYIFNRLVIGNTISKEFQYIRDVTNPSGAYDDTTWLKSFPIYGSEDANLTCGRGSYPVHNAATIETAKLHAGQEVGFMLSGPYFEGDTQPQVFHEGPGQVFLSKLPSNVKSLNEYDGKGDFFKIAYAGPRNATAWTLMEQSEMKFTIPKATPPGLYLLRIEQFLANWQRGQSQWFVSCAHVEILGTGTGSPGPMVRFPAYKDDDPGVWFHDEGTGFYPKDLGVYQQLKPDVWSG